MCTIFLFLHHHTFSLTAFFPFQDCWQQCDPHFKRTEDSWWYNSIKNKARLHAGLENRKEQKKLMRERREAQEERESVQKPGLEDAKLF